MMFIKTAKIKVNVKHKKNKGNFNKQSSRALVIMNLLWLNMIKFFSKLHHSSLVMEDEMCLPTPPHT